MKVLVQAFSVPLLDSGECLASHKHIYTHSSLPQLKSDTH